MPKYFKVGKLLIDIDELRPEFCLKECDTKVTLPHCAPIGTVTKVQCHQLISRCKFIISEGCRYLLSRCEHLLSGGCLHLSEHNPCAIIGTPCGLISPWVAGGFIDLGDPEVIVEIKEQLQVELERMDRLEKTVTAELQPRTAEDFKVIEEHLDVSQRQIDEARAELKKMKAKVATKKTPKK